MQLWLQAQQRLVAKEVCHVFQRSCPKPHHMHRANDHVTFAGLHLTLAGIHKIVPSLHDPTDITRQLHCSCEFTRRQKPGPTDRQGWKAGGPTGSRKKRYAHVLQLPDLAAWTCPEPQLLQQLPPGLPSGAPHLVAAPLLPQT